MNTTTPFRLCRDQITYKGVIYFATHRQASEICKSLVGTNCQFFGQPIKAAPRVVRFARGYAVQYCKSGSYYPEEAPQD